MNNPVDISTEQIKNMSVQELRKSAKDIRAFLIDSVSKTGGHLAANLGAVEITLALHHVFNFPNDKIVWDVGHQSYTHKVLTGRATILQKVHENGGISGFPRRDESEFDSFNTGHSSTAISSALGIAKANEICGNTAKTIAVVGDGALTGGLAFEGLNNAGNEGTNLIIVVNDNQMSISKNVGAFSHYLNNFRALSVYNNFKNFIDVALNKIPLIGKHLANFAMRFKAGIRYIFLPRTIFEELGFKYYGPIDGHNLNELILTFKKVQNLKGPIVVHTITTKGKGYNHAEKEPSSFHAVVHFDVNTGVQIKGTTGDFIDANAVMGETLLALAKDNPKITAITAAMTSGTGLRKFREELPERFFDVGIAEAHAITFACGMATSNLRPIACIYSSFLQRGYDQVLHDLCLQKLPVILAISCVGLNLCGETHHGIYDLSMLGNLPNINIFAPASAKELAEMLEFSFSHSIGPIAIRYPKKLPISGHSFEFGKAKIVRHGKSATLVAVGDMLSHAQKVADIAKKSGVDIEIVSLTTIRPLDVPTIRASAVKTGRLFTLENGIAQNGASSLIASAIPEFPVHSFGFSHTEYPQWATFETAGLSAENIAKIITQSCKVRAYA